MPAGTFRGSGRDANVRNGYTRCLCVWVNLADAWHRTNKNSRSVCQRDRLPLCGCDSSRPGSRAWPDDRCHHMVLWCSGAPGGLRSIFGGSRCYNADVGGVGDAEEQIAGIRHPKGFQNTGKLYQHEAGITVRPCLASAKCVSIVWFDKDHIGKAADLWAFRLAKVPSDNRRWWPDYSLTFLRWQRHTTPGRRNL